MNLKNRSGFYFVKILILATVLKFSFSAEVINGENPREFYSVGNEVPQEVPVIILSDNFYDKRSNLNKFKNLMITKDNVNPPSDNGEREEQFSYFPRINHAGAGKRATILSLASLGNRRYGTLNFRQPPSNYGNSRQAAA